MSGTSLFRCLFVWIGDCFNLFVLIWLLVVLADLMVRWSR